MIIDAKMEITLDLEELQDQKRWLIANSGRREADGLLNLLDAIQDQIHETGQAGERAVFGNYHCEEHNHENELREI